MNSFANTKRNRERRRRRTTSWSNVERSVMSKLVEEFEREQMNREITAFNPGDTVVVRVKVKEGNRERLQAFEGWLSPNAIAA